MLKRFSATEWVKWNQPSHVCHKEVYRISLTLPKQDSIQVLHHTQCLDKIYIILTAYESEVWTPWHTVDAMSGSRAFP